MKRRQEDLGVEELKSPLKLYELIWSCMYKYIDTCACVNSFCLEVLLERKKTFKALSSIESEINMCRR